MKLIDGLIKLKMFLIVSKIGIMFCFSVSAF